jgi:hypothetical protein
VSSLAFSSRQLVSDTLGPVAGPSLLLQREISCTSLDWRDTGIGLLERRHASRQLKQVMAKVGGSGENEARRQASAPRSARWTIVGRVGTRAAKRRVDDLDVHERGTLSAWW